MNNKVLVFLACVPVGTCLTQTQETILDRINKGSVASVINHGFAKIDVINLLASCLNDAPLEYQELLRETKKNLDLINEGPDSIKTISPLMKQLIQKPVSAFAGSQAIAFDVEMLNEKPYGTKRFIMYHELMHIKYHDTTNAILSDIGTCLLPLALYYVLTHKTPWQTHYPLLHSCGALIMGLSGTRYIHTHYFRTAEHRADLHAAYACNCYQCVQEFINDTRNNNQQELAKCGYLTAQELTSIAQELKEKNCLCTYHRKHASASVAQSPVF